MGVGEEGGECESDKQVLSEVHLGCPPHFVGTYITHFTFPFTPKDDLTGSKLINLDDDGDLVLVRRRDGNDANKDQIHTYDTKCQSSNLGEDDLFLSLNQSCVTGPLCKLAVQHSITTSLPNVGLQVWMAALLLSDYFLHRSLISSDFDGITALELGSGTGLAGIVLARIAKTVFLTDHGNEILTNCVSNAHLNSSFIGLNKASIHVRELDWTQSWPPRSDTFQISKYSWMTSEVAEVECSKLVLAADVIYDDDLTESFFSILEKLFSRGSEKVLYLALEKRYNFSLSELDVVANGYARFRSLFMDDEDCMVADKAASFPCFVGEQIDVSEVPQYIREYERSKELELWKIRYCTAMSQL